jgi:glutamine cyclotransferase
MSQTQSRKNHKAKSRTAANRSTTALILAGTVLALAMLAFVLTRINDFRAARRETISSAAVSANQARSMAVAPLSTSLPTETPTATPAATLTAESVTPETPTTPPEAVQSAAESPLVAAAAADAQNATPIVTPDAIPLYTYEVVNVYPHDPDAFTQGLVFDGDTLYEGTGLNGRSSLRRVDLLSGTVLQQIDLPSEYFGEGIVVWGDQIVQLTWQSRRGFLYDKTTFARQGEFAYETQGWGITHDTRRLIMSDGSATLYFWDPDTFRPVDAIHVYDLNGAVAALNELEYVKGEIFANIWQTDRIARIDAVTGQVLGWIDLSGLLTPEERANADVLNGIAYKPDTDQLFVTGKLWPKLFEIRLIPQ